MPDAGAGSDAAEELTRAASAVLEQLRGLASELRPLERAVLGALVAPGIAGALEGEADVAGFGLVEWDPQILPRALAEVVQRRRVDLRFDLPDG